MILLASCADEQTLEPTIDARPGIEQVGGADGPLLDEDEACELLHEALDEAKSGNGCDELDLPDCPELIRPAGSLACVRYSEESIDECVARVNGYRSCDDFVSDACIVVAVVDESSEGCVPPEPSVEDAGDDQPSEAVPDDDAQDDDTQDDAQDDDAQDDDAQDDDGSGAEDDLPSLGDAGWDGAVSDDDVTDAGGVAPEAGTMSDPDTGSSIPGSLDSGTEAEPVPDPGAADAAVSDAAP